MSKRNRKIVALTSATLALAMIALIMTPAYAYGMWNFDYDTGDYIYIEAGVAGNYNGGKLYSPAAYIKATILEDLPLDYVLVIYWRFEWTDVNHVLHVQYDTEDLPGYHYQGQTKRIEPTGLPYVVYDIVAEGRAGYDGIWDTDLVCASLPWL